MVVANLVDPLLVHVLLPRPAVLKLRTGGKAVGRSVEVLALVEWRVGGDQVNALAVHAPEELEVVAVG